MSQSNGVLDHTSIKTSRLTTFYPKDLKERDHFGNLRMKGSVIISGHKDVN
jgi:hypothetical protein